MNLQKIEDRIRRSVTKVTKTGAQIVHSSWGVDFENGRWTHENDNKTCCPLGAVLLCTKVKPGEEYPDVETEVAKVLRLPNAQASKLVSAFVNGVDCAKGEVKAKEPGNRLEREFFRMGRRIRRDFKLQSEKSI